MIQDVIVDFFYSRTSVRSGAKRLLTRRLGLQKHMLQCQFYVKYPQLLRHYRKRCPPLRKQNQMTKLQADTRAAVWAAVQPGISEEIEYKSRYDKAMREYLQGLARASLCEW